MPGVFGGLMRYNEEYTSKLRMKPAHLVILVVLFALAVIGLKFFMPVTSLS